MIVSPDKPHADPLAAGRFAPWLQSFEYSPQCTGTPADLMPNPDWFLSASWALDDGNEEQLFSNDRGALVPSHVSLP